MNVSQLMHQTLAAMENPAAPLSSEVELFIVETELSTLLRIVRPEHQKTLQSVRKRIQNKFGEKRRQQKVATQRANEAMQLTVAQASVVVLSGQISFAQSMEASRLAAKIAPSFNTIAFYEKTEDSLLSVLTGLHAPGPDELNCVAAAARSMVLRKLGRSKAKRSWNKRLATMKVQTLAQHKSL